ncbi:MAG TPA: threonine--tRNA ligase [Chloroflexota bacterium]|nr:threonine--tRNA ligase [Chloroflexota bacterium]
MFALAPHPNDDLERLRHSTAHVLARAITELFPGSKLGLGAADGEGFYCDVEAARRLDAADLPRLQERMRAIILANEPFEADEINLAEATSSFADQPYRREILAERERGVRYRIVRCGQFEDLCDEPNLERTGEIDPEALHLTHIAGAYWRGNEKNPMLQRVYGVVFPDAASLENYRQRQDEIRRRDHRVLGRELELFSISDAVGPGLILWHPRGAQLRRAAEEFLRRALDDAGYQWVVTPHIGRAYLWETSGHLAFFRDDMYPAMDADGERYYARPMNCPFHAEIFKSRLRSYRDLPLRLAEFGTLYRYERSGSLLGLARTRGLTQDDGHIFCRPEDAPAEIEGALHLALATARAFGLVDFIAELSTRPEKAVGPDEAWEEATATLRAALEKAGIPSRLDEGGGAFYGPKASLLLRDSLGREWQCGTIQYDFTLSERFGLEYVAEDGSKQRPVIIHRAMMGSMERFLAILIEHHSGAFPLWLAPVQVTIIPVAGRHLAAAEKVAATLRHDGRRVEIDAASDRVGQKIRRAEVHRIPYMLIVGDREGAGMVSVRSRDAGDLGIMSLDELRRRLQKEASPAFPPVMQEDDWNSRCC